MSLLLAPLPFSNWSESRKISKRRRAAGCAWDLHLEKSRDFICEALPSKRSGRGVVLGSGPLFDVPLKELAASFETVVFVDLYHPKAAKVAAAQYENVELVSCDVTGIAKPLRAAVRT
ncbi:MAG: hypothetical protein JKY92_06035, partial [Magnetovibrio sp.]|nr:hypothetical protein [Magnetovibrio sp.]